MKQFANGDQNLVRAILLEFSVMRKLRAARREMDDTGEYNDQNGGEPDTTYC